MELVTELRAEVAQLKAEPEEHVEQNPDPDPKPVVKDQIARAPDGTILNVPVPRPIGSIVPFPKGRKPESQKGLERQQRADARMFGGKRRWPRIGG